MSTIKTKKTNKKNANVVLENKKQKAIVVSSGKDYYAVTKSCMPEEDFQNIFPTEKISGWEHVNREEFLNHTDIYEAIKKNKIGEINCNIRKIMLN